MRKKTRSDLAKEYGVSLVTFKKWIKPLNFCFRKRRLMTSKEVEKIYEFLGEP